MVRVTGKILGISQLVFAPSVPRLSNDVQWPVLRAPIRVLTDPDGSFSVDLPDNNTWVAPDHQPWQWMVTELGRPRSDGEMREVRFAITSDAGEYNYAEIRPWRFS